MSPLLRVLMLVDTVAESDMLAHELRRTGFELAVRRATTEAAYLAALESPLDLILADDALPEFDAMRALQILRTSELDIPLIVVTESAGEAAAIECVSLGAADFFFKDRPARLGTAVVRALDQRELRAHARAADAALHESEERFRSAYEYAAIGMALVGLDGRWLQANRALCDFTGYTEPELLAMTFQAITHPDDLAIDLTNLRALVAGEIRSYQMEKRYFHKHGATIWVLLSVSLVRDAQRQPRYFVSQIQDITARKQADATRALLAAIVDSSDDAIIGVAPDGTVMSWNTGAEQLYGYRTEQMIGRPIAILWPPDLQDEASQMYDRLARGENITQIETVRLRNDGRLIDVALTISVINDAGGGVSGFSTIARDISARKRADHVLRQKTALIQLFQEVAVAANQATSLDQALQTAIDAICTHIGWPIGHVYLPDPAEPGALLPTHIWHLEDAQRFDTFRKITEAVRLAPGIGLPGQVLASRKPAWIADMILDASTPRTRVIQDIGVRAGFALPVLLGDDVAAVLEFFATEAIEPDAALLDVLQHVGTQLGRVVERTRGEASLRSSQARLAGILDIADDAIISVDNQQHITLFNQGAEKIFGYTVPEVLGQPINLLLPRRFERIHQQHLIELAGSAETARRMGERRDIYGRRKDGSEFPAEASISKLDLDGEATFTVILRDISERKRAEDALRAAEAQYRTLVEQLPAIIYTAAIDAHSTTSYVSPQIEAILGFSPEEWIANPDLWFEQVHPDDRARVLEIVGRAHASDAPIPIEFRSFTRDGRVVWLRDAARVVRDESGRPLFMQGITLDITDRKRAEDALRAAEAQYRTLVEQIPAIIYTAAIDERSSTYYVSPQIETILGFSPEEWLVDPQFWLTQVHPDDLALVLDAVSRSHASEAPIPVEYRSYTRDGRVVWLLDAGQMVRDQAGQPLFLQGIMQDITERKRTEEALARYQLLSEHARDIILFLRSDGRIIQANQAALLAYGYTRDELLALSIYDLRPAGTYGEVVERLAQVDDAGILYEAIHCRKDARLFPVEISSRSAVIGGERVIVSIIRDITERKQTEAALLEREAYFRALIEHSADAVALFAVDGTILYCSPATPRILGYAVQELVGRNAFDLIHPDDQAQVAEQLGHIAGLPESTMSIQSRVRHADGSWRVLEGRFTNLLGDPAVRAIVNNYRDITERKRAETALRESERLYRTLASNFPNGAVVLFDPDLRFTIADGAGLSAFGLTREAMEGRTIWEVYGPELSAEQEVYYRAALAGMPHVREITVGDLTLVVHTLPVRDEHGAIIAGMLMSQDITERKRMEAALIDERALLARRVDERTADLSAANAELARTAMLKDAFLASMSHELRTPLNAVLGLSEALQEEVYGSVTDRQRRSLHSIEESGRHLLDLINDILDLAKIGAGKLELDLEPTSVATICQASMRLITQLAHTKQLTVDLTLDPAVTLLHVDGRRVKQMLVNLLSNAVKFTPAGGSIGLEVVGDAVRQAVDLTVWDTGIGIAQEQMAQLFQPFVQLDSRLARQYAGTGLGLALVYRMVELHGGSIGVTSVVGRGSRFTIALPWPTDPADAPANALAAPDGRARDRTAMRRALVVEDSPTSAHLMLRYLRKLAIVSVIVGAGAEVVARAIDEQPDLIMLDLLLPDISGWDVLAQLKAEPRTRAIPVVITSAINERARGLALGAADYLVKPVVLADLARVVPMIMAAPRGYVIPQTPRATGATARALPLPLVLLAEDNAATITLIADYLGTRGYHVVLARNGAEALARAREVRPAIVLMDIQMPGMDGLEATRRIRTIDDLVDLPIIALTALAMPGDRERCLAAGANDYLSKPVSLRGLASLIAHMLQAHASQQRNTP